MKKTKISLLILSLMLFFINTINVKALGFNTNAEDLWGGWDSTNSTSLKNDSFYKYRCEKVEDKNKNLIINNYNGCILSSADVTNNYTATIKIIRTAVKDNKEQTVNKKINMRANAVTKTIKVGETYNAAADFNRLGLKVYLSCSSSFSVKPEKVLQKGLCGSSEGIARQEATAINPGEGVIQLESMSGIKFRAILNVIATNQLVYPIERYIGDYEDATFQGTKLNCGDLVKITSCDESTNAISTCQIESINGKSVTGTKVYRQKLVTAKPTCSSITTNPTIKTTTKPPTKSTIKTTTKNNQLPVVVIPVSTPPQVTEFPVERYAGNFEGITFEGSKVSCGDKVRITSCDDNTGDGATCKIESINGVKVSGTKVYRQKIMVSEPTCPTIKRFSMGATYYTDKNDIDKTSLAKKLTCGEEITFNIIPKDACVYGNIISESTDDNTKRFCEVSYNGSTIYIDRRQIAYDTPVCFDENSSEEPDQFESTCTPQKTLKEQTSFNEKKIPICYTYENKKLTIDGTNEKNIFKCAKGYRRTIKPDSENDTCSKLKSSSKKQSCYKTYIYSCLSVDRPKIYGTGSISTPDGIGTITLKGYDSTTNTGLKGYIINYGSKPTRNSSWTPYPNNEYETVEQKKAGTHFAWTMTNDMSISYPIMLIIQDDDITTTASEISLKDPNNTVTYPFTPIQTDNTTAYTEGVKSSNYVRLSNQLINDSIIASGFDLFQTAYELTVESDKVAVYATLTSNDSRYVEGYEPRTVSLEYGRNVILIKIENSNGKERTYTFVVTRTDNRESINSLKSLTTSIGSINFDPYVSDYTISVPKNAKTVNINGTLESPKAAFIKGYEPRKVELTNDITSAVLKTISEAGITRNYVLTFIKTGAELTEDISNSVYLSSLTIPGTEIMFDRETLSYTVAVEYENENIPIYALPESENATVEINGNIGLNIGTNRTEITVTNGSRIKIYNVFIIRKEDGLEVSSNTKLETLTVKNYDINFKEDVTDYTIKIKREKTLLLTATPQSNRSEVYMYGNNDLNAFSTIRIKVIAENGDTGLYSVDIIKDVFNKKLETTIAIVTCIIILGGGIIIMVNKKRKSLKDYIEE